MDKVTLAYDEETGRIVSYMMGDEEDYDRILASDPTLRRDHGLEGTRLRTMVVDFDPASFSPAGYRIADGRLVPLKTIALTTDAPDAENPNGVPEIAGDGVSTCTIAATVMGANGEVDRAFAGTVRFTTQRGRLSARNGIVPAREGVAEVVLTSVAETVPPFEVWAEAEGCLPGSVRLEFY